MNHSQINKKITPTSKSHNNSLHKHSLSITIRSTHPTLNKITQTRSVLKPIITTSTIQPAHHKKTTLTSPTQTGLWQNPHLHTSQINSADYLTAAALTRQIPDQTPAGALPPRPGAPGALMRPSRVIFVFITHSARSDGACQPKTAASRRR